MHKDDFTLKGKRVSIRDLEKTTRNINYDDFFKARISKDSDGYDINFFCKDGIDILSFIILGMITSLSSLGVFDTEFGFKSGAHDYLYDLADFLTSRGYLVVSTSNDFDKTLSALNRIYLENDVTLQTIKRHALESEYKSLYFVSSFGTSMFRPNIITMSSLISYLTCLSFSEEGRKKIVEAFCYFAPAIVISGAQVFSGVSSEYLKNLNSICSSVLSSYFGGNKYLKFKYENFKLNDTMVVSDIEGVSFFLAFYYASILTFGSKASSFFNLDKKSVSLY